MGNQMDLKNGYVVMYNAPEKVTETAPGPIYAFKPATETTEAKDAMLISYDADDQYINLKTFKLIYCDGARLRGSLTGMPADTDTVIIIKSADGDIVFGQA